MFASSGKDKRNEPECASLLGGGDETHPGQAYLTVTPTRLQAICGGNPYF